MTFEKLTFFISGQQLNQNRHKLTVGVSKSNFDNSMNQTKKLDKFMNQYYSLIKYEIS